MLDSDTWQRTEDLFVEALERPREERASFLEEACAGDEALRAEVASLVASYEESDTFLESIDAAQAEALMAAAAAPEPRDGGRVGPWRVARELGRGGMGVVYLAERADGQFEQRVALKLVKRGMDSDAILARFLNERQVLATLQHPWIARFFDGGVTEEGQPYFAMEYVEGLPITDYCEAQGLSVDERLALFLKVCRAVEHAHNRLIIHRDLKPSNILVTEEGEPRLLDFGLAKVLQDPSGDPATTRRGQRWLTLEYASPEQVKGEPVGTPSDTYQLGLVLYEMLTGRQPYTVTELSPTEAERVICEENPTKPSTAVFQGDGVAPHGHATRYGDRLHRKLRGDLDTILLKALQKDPARRYASAEALANDIDRHLEGLPIHARPDTTGYRVTKFVQRHRVAVAAAATIVLSLVGGLGAALWQAGVAREQAERSEQTLNFLTSLFESGDPRQETRVESIEELLASGVERAQSDLKTDPVLQGSVLLHLAEVYLGRAEFVRARDLADSARTLLEPVLGDSDRRIADLYRVAGLSRYRLAENREAARLLREAASLYGRHGDVEARLESLSGVAGSVRGIQDYESALTLQKQIVAETQDHFGLGALETASSRADLGIFAIDAGDFTLAEKEIRSAIGTLETLGPEADVPLAFAKLSLAGLLDRLGRSDEARRWFEQGIRELSDLFGAESGPVANARFSEGIFFLGRHQPEAAEANFRRVISASEATPTLQAHARRYLGKALQDQGLLADAISAYAAAERAYLEVGGTAHEEQAYRAAADRGNTLTQAGDPGTGAEVLIDAVAGIEAIRGEEHYNLIRPLTFLAAAQEETGNLEEARTTAQRAAAMAEEILGPDHEFTLQAVDLSKRLTGQD